MKWMFAVAACAAVFAGVPAHAQGNPGKSAMDCVTATRDGQDVKFSNRCDHKVFVAWCGALKYSKKRCGDGPAGNSYYTHSSNIAPNGTTSANGVVGDYKYAACVGGIGFSKTGFQDQPDGTFACLPTGAAKKAAAKQSK